MIKGNITRTFFTVRAKGFRIDRMDGITPIMSEVSCEFITTNPKDTREPYRLLKEIDKKVIKETISVEVVSEDVYGMSLQDFYNLAEPVERAANGRIK